MRYDLSEPGSSYGCIAEALGGPWRYAISTPSKETRSRVLYAAADLGSQGQGDAHDLRLELAAAAVEMLHLGTLVHDDVVDDSKARRGQPSLCATYGPALAAATGGGIFGHALGLFARCGEGAVALAADAAAQVCAGQMLELRGLHDLNRTAEEYREAIQGKTAGMFWLAAKLGGSLVGASSEELEQLALYGSALGVGFQIVDDILDITVDERETGKPKGMDLSNGNYTLPVIYALEERSALATLLLSDAPVESIIDCIGETHAEARASTEAERWIKQAKAAVDGLPAAQRLLDIADAELAALDGTQV